MKKLMYLILLLLSNIFVFAQKVQTAEEQGKADIFFSRKGTILEKTYTTVATLKTTGLLAMGYPVEVLKIKDLRKNDSLMCLRMSTVSAGTSVTGYINSDEMDNVINFLQMASDKYLLFPPPATDIELEYTCESRFSISVFKGSKGWMIGISPKSYASIFFEKDMMPYVIGAFKKAKDAMK